MTDDLYQQYKEGTMTWTEVAVERGLSLYDGHRWLDTQLRNDPSAHYMRDVVCECCSTVLGEEDAYHPVEARTEDEKLWSRDLKNWLSPHMFEPIKTYSSWERYAHKPARGAVQPWE